MNTKRQVILTLAGVALIALGVFLDRLGIGSPGFGPGQAVIVLAGVGVVGAGFALRSRAVVRAVRRPAVARLALTAGSVLVGLMAVEMVLRGLEMRGGAAHVPRGLEEHPRLGVRMAPGSPGHDARGWRNESACERADVVAIGDSQTWGINVPVQKAWPQALEEQSGLRVYSVALVSYGPVQYHALMEEALELAPGVVMVAIYLGNDLWDAYYMVYQNEAHTQFRDGSAPPELREDTVGPSAMAIRRKTMDLRGYYPPWASSRWRRWLYKGSATIRFVVRLASGGDYEAATAWTRARPDLGQAYRNGDVWTVLTTAYRLRALDLEDPRIAEGLRITTHVLPGIKAETSAAGARLLVLLIPTKETVYAAAVERAAGGLEATHGKLVEMEARARAEIISSCQQNGIECVDLLPALAECVTKNQQIYPKGPNGHPTADGYSAIASRVHKALLERGWAGEPGEQ